MYTREECLLEAQRYAAMALRNLNYPDELSSRRAQVLATLSLSHATMATVTPAAFTPSALTGEEN